MANDTIEKSVPMIGGGANAFSQTSPVPVAPAASKAPATLIPKNTAQAKPKAQASAMATFLAPSNRTINRSKYNAEKLADIDGNLANNYIKADAENDTDAKYALHTILTGGQPSTNTLVPDEKSAVTIDTNLMRANIKDSKYNLSADDQIKYGRAMKVFDTMTANNFQVMKGPGGVYWMESMENGKKVYASNGILEVADLLDKFSGPVSATGVPVPVKEVETNPKKLALLINDDPNQELFTESEKWHMAALGTDLVTSLIGVTGKAATGVTGGAGFLAGAAGVATSVTGGLASLGMSMYGDLLDQDVSAGEMWKNAAIRGGLEAMETVSVMPVSLMSSLRGASKAGKILRKGMHLMMLKGTLDTAIGMDWEATMNKETWEMEDYRKMASMAQFMVGAVGGAAANRYATRKGLTVKTQVANEELGDFAKTVKPGKLEEAAALAKARIPKQQQNLLKRTDKIEAQTGAAIAKQKLKAKGERSVFAAQKEKDLADALKANAAPMPTLPVLNGVSTNTPALIPKPVVDIAAMQARHITEGKTLNAKLKGESKAIVDGKTLRLKKINDSQEDVLKRADAMTNNRDDRDINIAYTKKNATDRAALNTAEEQAIALHGTLIGSKLKARAQKRSGVSEEKLEASKPVITAAAKSESKLDTFAKEKVALETKNKGVAEADKSPEDIVEMKRITDGMAEEAKNLVGLKGAKNKLFSKVKEGSTFAGKGYNKALSVANTIPSSLAVSDGISSRGLARATINGKFVDDLTGNRFYQYTMEQATGRLVEEGFSLAEIEKYSLKQLREVLHKIESDAKKAKEPVAKTDLIKRPKSRQAGGRLIESPAAGLVRMFRGGGKEEPMAFWGSDYDSERVAIAKKVASDKVAVAKVSARIARNKVVAAQNVINRKTNSDFRARQAAKNKLISIKTNDIKPVGELTDVEIAAMRDKDVADAADKDKEAVAAKYDGLIAAAPKAKSTPWGLAEISKLTKGFKLSDLMGTNRILMESPVQDDVIAPVFQSRGVRDMPGFQESLNRTTLQQRYDGADSFASAQLSREMHNDGEKRRAELVTRNAGFVESSRDEEIANQNRNMESSINAMNSNTQRRNAAEANFVAQKVQARAQYETAEQQRKGRLANAAMSGLSDLVKSKKSANLTMQFNDAASMKSKWNNEYKVKYDTAVAAGDANKVKQIKSEFIELNKFDPDELDKQMMGIKTQFRALEA